MKLSIKQWSNSLWQYMVMVLLVLFAISCGSNDKVGAENMISGSGSKTWQATQAVAAGGDQERLSEAERQETMQFYADGRFALGGGGTLETGTWSFDQAANRLTLQFEGENVTENFEVLELSEREMRLRTPDGSEMELRAQ